MELSTKIVPVTLWLTICFHYLLPTGWEYRQSGNEETITVSRSLRLYNILIGAANKARFFWCLICVRSCSCRSSDRVSGFFWRNASKWSHSCGAKAFDAVFAKQVTSHLLTRKTDALASVVSDRCVVVEGCGVGSESTVVGKRLHYSRGVHSCAVVFQWMLKCLMEHLV